MNQIKEQLSFEKMSKEDLRRKLHNSRMENQQLRFEHAKMAKEIKELKTVSQDWQREFLEMQYQHNQDFKYQQQLEKELQLFSLKSDKLKKQKRQLIQNTKKANQLFRQTLEVKLEYEELITKLFEMPEVNPILVQLLPSSKFKVLSRQQNKSNMAINSDILSLNRASKLSQGTPLRKSYIYTGSLSPMSCKNKNDIVSFNGSQPMPRKHSAMR